jgi:hypothetical protein
MSPYIYHPNTILAILSNHAKSLCKIRDWMRQKLENSSLTGQTQESLGMLDKFLPTKKNLVKRDAKVT